MTEGDGIELAVPKQLHGCFVKLKRARAYLDELDRRVAQLAGEAPYRGRVQDARDGWQELVVEVGTEPDPDLGAVYGDAASNVRASLDYLANELGLLNGHGKRDAKFPVFTDGKEFDQKVATYLRGVHPDHVAAIRAIQPFQDENPEDHPLAQMAWISNRDKHRGLQPAWVVHRESRHDLDLSLDLEGVELYLNAGPLSDGDVAIAMRTRPPRRAIKSGTLVLDIGFGDRLLTRDQLGLAIRYTLWVLSRFREAWGYQGAAVPEEVAYGRLRSERVPRGELEVIGISENGEEVRRVIPVTFVQSALED